MIKFITFLILFSIPILLILIVNLRRRQRIVYTHTFLNNFDDRSIKDFLFRTFQLYFDIIFDILLAVLLALFLSGLVSFKGKKTAVCIDGSYSMLSSLDRALEKILYHQTPEPHDLFILSFNPSRARVELSGINRLKKCDTTEEAREMLLSRFTFFNQDLKQAAKLYEKGYDHVLLITDTPPSNTGSLEILDVGKNEPECFFYPTCISYDFVESVFIIILYRHNFNYIPRIELYNREKDRYEEFPSFNHIDFSETYSEIRLKQEGLFRFSSPDIDFTVALKKPILKTSASGKYSRIMIESLPQIEEGEGSILLADLDMSEQANTAQLSKQISSSGKYKRKIVTFLPAEPIPVAQDYIQPLEKTLSQPCLTEFPDILFNTAFNPDHTTVFYQDPERVRDMQTPIAYLSELEAEFTPPLVTFETDLLSGSSLIHRGINTFVYKKKESLVPLNLSPEEFFPLSIDYNLIVTESEPNRMPLFFLLLLIYILKIIFLNIYFRKKFS